MTHWQKYMPAISPRAVQKRAGSFKMSPATMLPTIYLVSVQLSVEMFTQRNHISARASLSSQNFSKRASNLGVNLSQQGKHRAAISQLNEAVRLDPNNVTALYRLGQAETALGLNSDAIKHLRRAVDLDPKRPEIALLLATALFANADVVR